MGVGAWVALLAVVLSVPEAKGEFIVPLRRVYDLHITHVLITPGVTRPFAAEGANPTKHAAHALCVAVNRCRTPLMHWDPMARLGKTTFWQYKSFDGPKTIPLHLDRTAQTLEHKAAAAAAAA